MIDRLEFILFSSLGFLVRLLPLRVAQAVGRFLGFLSYLTFPRRREIARDNLAHAFPEKSRKEIERIARGAFQNFAISMAEFLWFPRLTPKRLRKFVRFVNVDLIGEAYARGKGLILMSGHFGNWELIALSTSHFSGYPLTIIVQKQSNAYVNEVINRYRCLWGNSLVPMEHSVRETLKKLSDGSVVAMLADQAASKDGLFIPFFGRSAATHQGPAIFSLRTGAPILMGFLIRRPHGNYEAIYEEVVMDDLEGYTEENVAELTRRHVAMLEKYIRQYPEQWLWTHRRWKHTPKESVKELENLSTPLSSVPVAETAERR